MSNLADGGSKAPAATVAGPDRGAGSFDPREVPEPEIGHGYAYWRSLCRDRLMPSRRDIDPAAIKDLLPNVFLVEVLHGPPEFRFRLAGTQIRYEMGEEITGKTLDEIDQDGRAGAIFEEYRAAVDRGAPVLFREEYTRHDGKFVHYARLLCPLSDDGRAVSMLFGVLVATPLVRP